jgi:signal transduction histidine kinase
MMGLNKLILCISLFFLAPGWHTHAQSAINERAESLIDSAHYYELRSPQRAMEFARTILNEIPEKGNERYHINALILSANSQKMLSSRKDALTDVNKAIAWSRRLNDPEMIVRSSFMKATIFDQDDEQDSALFYYQEVIRVFPGKMDSFYLSAAYSNVGTIYRTIGNFAKAEEYTLKGYALSKQDEEYDMIFALSSVISLYLEYEDPKYLPYFDTLVQTNFFRNASPEFQMAHFDTFLELQEATDEQREKRLREVYAYSCEHSSLANQVGYGMNLYRQLANTRKFGEGEKLLHELLGKAKASGNGFKLAKVTQALFENAKAQNDLPAAVGYLEDYSALRDSLVSAESTQQIAELNIKFESVQKDNEIAQQKAKLDQEKRNRRFYLIMMVLLLALVITVFIYFRNRARTLRQIAQKENIIHQQETERLVKEKEIAELTASLESQEKERNRIARDLHDGIGSMMSGISAQIEYLKAQPEISGNGHQHLVQLKDMVNDATSELRRTSYELMPAKLLRNGLEPAIRDLCLNLLAKNGIEIALEINMDMTTLSADRQLSLYRIIQELLNNIVRHARASHVLLQFTQVDDEVSMVVEDDGIGFVTSEKQLNGGLGLGNLQNRINVLDGFLDIASSPGVGTTVTINFKNLV